MGFLNLSAWSPVGGKVLAERRSRSGFAQPPRYYYDNLREFQSHIDRFYEEHGRRPVDVAELYLWQLDQLEATRSESADSEASSAADSEEAAELRARELASFFCYYDIEPNSLLALVAIRPDHDRIASELLEARRTRKQHGHRPPRRIPMEAGLA